MGWLSFEDRIIAVIDDDGCIMNLRMALETILATAVLLFLCYFWPRDTTELFKLTPAPMSIVAIGPPCCPIGLVFWPLFSGPLMAIWICRLLFCARKMHFVPVTVLPLFVSIGLLMSFHFVYGELAYQLTSYSLLVMIGSAMFMTIECRWRPNIASLFWKSAWAMCLVDYITLLAIEICKSI